MSSQAICKACMLLEGLNKNKPKNDVILETGDRITKSVANLYIQEADPD